MPDSAVAEPPSAPSTPAAPAAPAQPELHVTAASVIDKGPPPPAPKKGSAQERMIADLRKKAGPAESEPAKPAAKPDDSQPPPQPSESQSDASGTTNQGAAVDSGKKPKVNPWKLVDEHKAARAQLEKEMLELKKQLPDPALTQKEKERIAAVEKRAQELEEEIRYVNYAKSQEFSEKYQKPYEESWRKWMNELGELRVQDSEGQERPIAPQDLLELVNLPLQKARDLAQTVFGDFADDVMDARKEIRNLFDAQNKALEEARKAGAARDEQRMQQLRQQQQETGKQISDLWKQFNDEAAADEKYGKFFKPVEGDDEGNQRLARGFEMADKAFASDPRNPKLTPAERAEIVKLHAVFRNRAAGFGRAIYQLQKAQAEIDSLKAELNKYKGSEPGKGEGVKTAANAAPQSAQESMMAALRKYAH